MGKGLGELNIVGGATASTGARRGRRPEESRVSVLDIRAALQDISPLTRSLQQIVSMDGRRNDITVISTALRSLRQAEELAAGSAPAQWERAELLLDQAFRQLGPAMAARGPQDPLARRFVTACNRDARRRGRHQILYLHHRGLFNRAQADITTRNIDKMFRAAVLQNDRTATALSVLERAERACERLGSKEDVEASPARTQASRFIHGIARISGSYLQSRMSRANALDDDQRQRGEAWLGSKAERQIQVAQAVASGLAHRSADKATAELTSGGALRAHQAMLTKIFGPEAARAQAGGQWFALTDDAYAQARAAAGASPGQLTRVQGLGVLTSESAAREAVSAFADNHLSPAMMKAMISRCLPRSRGASHPTVAAVQEGLRDGLVEALTVVAVRASGSREPTNATERDTQWAQIVHSAAAAAAPTAPAAALRVLARAPAKDRVRQLARMVTGRDDVTAQKTVLRVAAKLAASRDISQRDFAQLCRRGWQFARGRAAARNQLAPV
jgi:hypothetical protein